MKKWQWSFFILYVLSCIVFSCQGTLRKCTTVYYKQLWSTKRAFFFFSLSLVDWYGLGSEGENFPEFRRGDRSYEWTAGSPEVGTGSQPHSHHRVDRPRSGSGSIVRHRRRSGRRIHAVQAAAAAPPAAWYLDSEGVKTVGAHGRGSLPCHTINL